MKLRQSLALNTCIFWLSSAKELNIFPFLHTLLISNQVLNSINKEICNITVSNQKVICKKITQSKYKNNFCCLSRKSCFK